MSSTISFKKQKLQDKAVEIKRIGALNATLKYVPSKDLPAAEEKSSLIYTTDTAELFIGGGTGNPLRKVSDIIVVDDVSALPDIGLKEKLYISKLDKAIYYWEGTAYEQLGAGGSGGGSVQTKIFEYDKAADFPAGGQSKAMYIAKDTDFVYRFDVATSKYIQLARQSADPTIAARFSAIDTAVAAKADKTDLGDFRKKTDKVAETDLDLATQAKLNQNLTPYDDSAIKTRLSGVELNKADKTQLGSYRKTADKIAEADLDLDITSKLNSIPAPYNDTQVKNDILGLQSNKADKSALSAYRKTADKLVEADLDPAVVAKLDKPSYDDSVVMAAVADLENEKLDSVDAANTYRKKSDAIRESDLDPAVASKLNVAATGYDDTAIKLRVSNVETGKTDKTYAESTYMKKTDKVAETQLDSALTTKLSTMQTNISNKADASTVSTLSTNVGSLTSNVNNLQTAVNNKADNSTVVAMQNNIDNLENDLSTTANHVATVQTGLANMQTELDNKVDSTELANYRPVDEKITASDLDPTVATQVNKVPTLETTVADLLARIQALEGVASAKDIVSLVAIAPLNVTYGTLFASLLLPTKVTANLSDSSTASLSVVWDSSTYNANVAGTYTINGSITLPAGVTNTKNLKPSVQVTVAAQAGGSTGWEYIFTLPEMDWDITLDQIHAGLTISDEEFYGPGLDTGEGATVKVYYLGTEPTRQYASAPKYVPNGLQGAAGATSPTLDGFVNYDSSISTISFDAASLGKRVYKIVKA